MQIVLKDVESQRELSRWAAAGPSLPHVGDKVRFGAGTGFVDEREWDFSTGELQLTLWVSGVEGDDESALCAAADVPGRERERDLVL